MCAMMLFGEINRNVRDVFDAVQMLLAGGHDRFRLPLDQVVHDRKIVRRQIPDYAHIVLEESQVDAKRIVIVQVSQNTAFNQFA